MTIKSWGGLYLALVVFLICSSLSCSGWGGGKSKLASRPSLEDLTDSGDKSRSQLQQENESLRQRIAILSGLPEDARGARLHELQALRVTRYTGFYDKDEDGKLEKLIVYLQPVDLQGDVVKATGQVTVQLWRLDPKAEQSLLQAWHVDSEDLAQQWFATMMTINYRLVFDLPTGMDVQNGHFTVRVVFTDLMSGQVFTEQMPLKSH